MLGRVGDANKIWYKVGPKAQKVLLAKIAGGEAVGRRQKQRANLGVGQHRVVRPTDSKCQMPSIIRLPHTKTKTQYGQCGSPGIASARNAPVPVCTQQRAQK
jgi:hypothetical protein